MTENDILQALSTVQEPDLKKDLVTLNMIRDVEIDGDNISFTVVLTTPACPLKDLIAFFLYPDIDALVAARGLDTSPST